MANEYLLSKWQAWFKMLDVNHDGFLSQEDTNILKKKFASLHHFDEKKTASIGASIDDWWKTNIFKNHTEGISVQQFIDDLNKEYTADKVAFASKVNEEFESGYSTIVDVNQDGFISEEEFVVLFKSLGHTDEEMMKRMFKSLNPQVGQIEVKVLAIAWTDFLCNDDSSVPCGIKEALDSEKY